MKNRPKLMHSLADNLERLIAKNPHLSTNKAIEERSGVSRSTVQRIRAKEEVSPSIDKVEAIASAFNVTASELLSQGVEMATQEERETAAMDGMIELMVLYQQASARDRENIIELARAAAKRGALRWVRAANN